jgi:RHS repeat-associated protein
LPFRRAWSETFIFDGFGNLTDKNASGNATSVHMVVDPVTNRLQGLNQSDPKTGNLTAIGNMQMTYDVANRVSTVAISSVPAGMYGYDQDNHRVWTSGDQIHFFGAFGERLATFQPVSQGSPYLTQVTTDLYFAGRRIVSNAQVIMTDRLGSMRYGSNQASNFWFYPYGEEPSTTAQDRDKFATYYRDGTTGLDYAQNRYYSSQLGRFLTADPYRASGGPADPGSWNRYAYAGNDPVNFYGPSGLYECPAARTTFRRNVSSIAVPSY